MHTPSMNLLFWGTQKPGKHALWLFNGEKCWISICILFAIKWWFFFFLQKFSDTFHVQKYLRFLSKHTRVCVLFLLMMGKTNENLPLLDRARKKRKMKCKSSYINDPNCNLQFRIELPLQIERLRDYSFCVYLNKPNASLKRKEAQ